MTDSMVPAGVEATARLGVLRVSMERSFRKYADISPKGAQPLAMPEPPLESIASGTTTLDGCDTKSFGALPSHVVADALPGDVWQGLALSNV